eukprot:6186153-Pleurochrysis_carterae.AAC.2
MGETQVLETNLCQSDRYIEWKTEIEKVKETGEKEGGNDEYAEQVERVRPNCPGRFRPQHASRLA